MSYAPGVPTRRTALRFAFTAAATGAAVGLSGCEVSWDSVRAPEPPTRAPDVPADTALVEQVVAELRTTFYLAPQPFRGLHRTHLEALGATPGPPPQDPGGTPKSVRGRERALPDRLIRACQQAESGDLAALLASMAAAQRQLLHRNPEVIT